MAGSSRRSSSLAPRGAKESPNGVCGPYRLITTDDPGRTFGEGEMRYFATMLDAANAFVKATEPFKVIVYDDGCVARELDDRERGLLEAVCDMLGYDLGAVEG